jgi:hypothetical protein
MALFVRDGMAFIRTPKMADYGGEVPDDFLVLLGMAAAFQDPDFREQCLRVTRASAKAGHFAGLIDYHEDRDIN